MAWSLQKAPELTDLQFEQWNRLLEERTGIQLSSHQRSFLQIQLMARMRELGIKHYSQYYNQIAQGPGGAIEWLIMVDRLVVRETSFFRHRDSIELIRRLVQDRINNQKLNDSFEVWSLGCATGEEPFSLAMVINDCFALAGLEPYFGITATDISPTALQVARKAIYPARKLDALSSAERARYFKPVSEPSDHYQVVEKLCDRVCFSSGNVMRLAEMPQVKMDVIFCQNLLVYFRRWRRREILNEMADRLKPGGLLVIGLGEVVDWTHPHMRRLNDDRVQAYVRH